MLPVVVIENFVEPSNNLVYTRYIRVENTQKTNIIELNVSLDTNQLEHFRTNPVDFIKNF